MKSSALLLREFWEKYRQAHGGKPTKQKISRALGLDPHALTKWMRIDGPSNARIPVERIPQLARGLMLTSREEDRLMAARIAELGRTDRSVGALVRWLHATVRRRTRLEFEPEPDEQFVLGAYRLAAENFPRGLIQDEAVTRNLVAYFQVLLEDCEAAWRDEDAQDADHAPALADKAVATTQLLKAAARERQPRSKEALAAARAMNPPAK